MDKVLCFLDVDGVLNVEKPSRDFDDWQVTQYTEPAPWGVGKTYTLTTSREMCRQLMALPLEIVWLTDWKVKANWVISPLTGLPDNLKVLHGTDDDYLSELISLDVLGLRRWWKRRHIAAADRPFVWLDDNIRMMDLGWSKRRKVLTARDVRSQPHLALSMNSPFGQPLGNQGINKGLRLSDLRLIEAFCNQTLNQEKAA